MYIKKQRGKGRGEFELANEVDGIKASELTGLELYLDCGLYYGVRSTQVRVTKNQGKARLRIVDPHKPGALHLYSQVLSMLLLPESIREEKNLPGGQPTVMMYRYMVSYMHITSARIDGDKAIITLGDIELANQSDNATITFSERMAKIARLHRHAEDLPTPVRETVMAHHTLLKPPNTQEPPVISLTAEKLVTDLMHHVADVSSDYDYDYAFGTDVLPALEFMLKPPAQRELVAVPQIPDDELELRRRVVGQWRQWASARGRESVQFRHKVQNAYHQRCVVCGLRYPKSKHCVVPGVDAAHILPWADYDLDVISNGLCLCKLHHWAFDHGLIAIRMNDDGAFHVTVTETAQAALESDPDSLAELRRVEAKIPDSRLPFNPNERPNPNFLEKLYEAIRPDDTT